jgi:hypothetical protein
MKLPRRQFLHLAAQWAVFSNGVNGFDTRD